MAEMVVAMAIAAVAMVCIAQLMAFSARQNQELERHAVAIREAGNMMEDLVSRPWTSLETGKPPAVDASYLEESLPDPQWHIEIIQEEEGTENVKRITIEIDWVTTGNQRCRPVRLVAWRARNPEAAK
jgi:hypothetical protein